MKKIITWFKTRTINKIAIIATFVACGANLYCGCYWMATLWLLLAISWIIIDGYQRKLKVVCEFCEKNDKDIAVYIRSINLERAKVFYYLCLYNREKLIADYCKKDWLHKDSRKFINDLESRERCVEAASEMLQDLLKEYDNDNSDNEL